MPCAVGIPVSAFVSNFVRFHTYSAPAPSPPNICAIANKTKKRRELTAAPRTARIARTATPPVARRRATAPGDCLRRAASSTAAAHRRRRPGTAVRRRRLPPDRRTAARPLPLIRCVPANTNAYTTQVAVPWHRWCVFRVVRRVARADPPPDRGAEQPTWAWVHSADRGSMQDGRLPNNGRWPSLVEYVAQSRPRTSLWCVWTHVR